MHKLIISLTLLFALISCSSQKDNLQIEQKIQRIENGLVEFSSPGDMFQADSAKKDLKTLAERMAHYKVPGVSIAVMNDFKLEWAKQYGIIKAGLQSCSIL